MLLRVVGLTVVITLALWAGPAAAISGAGSVLSECADDLTLEPEPEPAPARLILPCAVAEHVLTANGDLACADATLYVVTHAGTLLCEVDVPALVASSSPTIERAPAATLSASSAFSAAGLWPTQAALPPPLVLDLAPAPDAFGSSPRDGHTRPPAVPS